MRRHKWNIKNMLILAISIAVSIYFLRSDFIQNLIANFADFKYIGSFLAGLFFASGFTVAPATVALIIIGESTNPFLVALIGGLGAIISDFLIFKLIKKEENSSSDFRYLIRKSKLNKLKYWKAKHRWLLPLIAGIIYITPLPDEAADFIFELAHYNIKKFLFIVYILHAAGIFAIAAIGYSL